MNKQIKTATVKLSKANREDLFYKESISGVWRPKIGVVYFYPLKMGQWSCRKLKSYATVNSFKGIGEVYVFHDWDRDDLKDYLFTKFEKLLPEDRVSNEHINNAS